MYLDIRALTVLNPATIELWRAAAAAARAYRTGTLTWDAFMNQFGEVPATDDDLAELVDLIEHEPARGGLGGLNEREYAEYVASVDATISRIESRVGAA